MRCSTYRQQAQADEQEFVDLQVMLASARQVRHQEAYLTRVEKNARKKYRRDEARRRRCLPTVSLESIMGREQEPVIPPFWQSLFQIQSATFHARQALESLSGNRKLFMQRHYMDKWTIPYIATYHEVTESEVRRVLRQAKKDLAARYRQKDDGNLA